VLVLPRRSIEHRGALIGRQRLSKVLARPRRLEGDLCYKRLGQRPDLHQRYL